MQFNTHSHWFLSVLNHEFVFNFTCDLLNTWRLVDEEILLFDDGAVSWTQDDCCCCKCCTSPVTFSFVDGDVDPPPPPPPNTGFVQSGSDRESFNAAASPTDATPWRNSSVSKWFKLRERTYKITKRRNK